MHTIKIPVGFTTRPDAPPPLVKALTNEIFVLRSKNHKIAYKLAGPWLKNHEIVSSWPDPGKFFLAIYLPFFGYFFKNFFLAISNKKLQNCLVVGWSPGKNHKIVSRWPDTG